MRVDSHLRLHIIAAFIKGFHYKGEKSSSPVWGKKSPTCAEKMRLCSTGRTHTPDVTVRGKNMHIHTCIKFVIKKPKYPRLLCFSGRVSNHYSFPSLHPDFKRSYTTTAGISLCTTESVCKCVCVCVCVCKLTT